MALYSLIANLHVILDVSGTKTADFANPAQSLSESIKLALTTGTTADKADAFWADQRTLTASQAEELDLQGGTLSNALGESITLSAVKFLYIRNRSTTSDLLVGGASSNAFDAMFGDSSDKVRVRRGGVLAIGATDLTSYAVDASDVLRLENEDSGASLLYDIVVVGLD